MPELGDFNSRGRSYISFPLRPAALRAGSEDGIEQKGNGVVVACELRAVKAGCVSRKPMPVRNEAVVGNIAGSDSGARIVTSFVAGCEPIADAGAIRRCSSWKT